jgi:hypothetical protein
MSFLHIYFGSKIYLLYCGADINHEFQIVYKNKTTTENDNINVNTFHNLYDEEYVKIEQKYLLKKPKTKDDCEKIIDLITLLKYKIITKEMLHIDSTGNINSAGNINSTGNRCNESAENVNSFAENVNSFAENVNTSLLTLTKNMRRNTIEQLNVSPVASTGNTRRNSLLLPSKIAVDNV